MSGHVPGRAARRGRRAPGPPVVRRQPVPPGVQVAPDPSGAALPRLRRRRARPRPRARPGRRGRKPLGSRRPGHPSPPPAPSVTAAVRTRGKRNRAERVPVRPQGRALESAACRPAGPPTSCRSSSSWPPFRAPPGTSARSPTGSRAYLRDLGLESPRTTRPATLTRATSSRGPSGERPARRSSSAPISTRCRRPAPIEPVGRGRRRPNGAGTILGADNKAAVAVMLEADAAPARGAPAARRGRAPLHRPRGDRLRGRGRVRRVALARALGFVYDYAGADRRGRRRGAVRAARSTSVHRARRRTPGSPPRTGARPSSAAARAIADLRLGRIDEETTANVGLIEGGIARNVVPEHCRVAVEARSRDERKLAELVQEMLDAFSFARRGRRSARSRRRSRTSTAATGWRRTIPRSARAHGARAGGVRAERGRGRTAAPTRTSSTSAGSTASTSPTAWPTSTRADEQIAVADLEAMVGVTLELVAAAREA